MDWKRLIGKSLLIQVMDHGSVTLLDNGMDVVIKIENAENAVIIHGFDRVNETDLHIKKVISIPFKYANRYKVETEGSNCCWVVCRVDGME